MAQRRLNGTPRKNVASNFLILSAPGRIRTADHLVRSQVLYPAELRAPARSLALMARIGNLRCFVTPYQRSPPPAMMISPVTQAEFSEARNTATEAMSPA